MPNYRINFVPRGSWEIVVQADSPEQAEEAAELAFTDSERLSDAGWEIEICIETERASDAAASEILGEE